MIRDAVYSRSEFPRTLEIQVLAFMRLEWGDALFSGEDRFRDRLWDDPSAVHFIRAAGDLLVSHAEVLTTSAAGSDGRSHLIAGVMGVITYPPFRGEGHASAVMRKVGEHILATDAEVGMLFTTHDLEAFYGPLGWRAAEAGQVLMRGRKPDNLVMLFGDTSLLPSVVRLEFQW
jgi:hypothetical protein